MLGTLPTEAQLGTHVAWDVKPYVRLTTSKLLFVSNLLLAFLFFAKSLFRVLEDLAPLDRFVPYLHPVVVIMSAPRLMSRRHPLQKFDSPSMGFSAAIHVCTSHELARNSY